MRPRVQQKYDVLRYGDIQEGRSTFTLLERLRDLKAGEATLPAHR